MKSVKVSKLVPGMVTGDTLYNPHNGSVLLKAHTILSDKTIAWLETIKVDALNIEEVLEEEPVAEAPKPAAPKSRSAQVKASKEFKEFEKEHKKIVNLYTNSINDFVLKNQNFNPKTLMDSILHIVDAERNRFNIFEMLTNLKSYDDMTYAHAVNVALISRTFGKWLKIEGEDLEALTLAGLLHDIGKIMIPEKILKKPGTLSFAEYEIMKTHTVKGYYKLMNANMDPRICDVALAHHERSDGSGYPYGLKSDRISSFASIVGIADVYDAMTSVRVYRQPVCPFKVIALFEQEGLQKYSPQHILTFLENVASCYMSCDVKLSNGKVGKVVFVNRDYLSKPMVQLDDNYVDLSKNSNLYIEKLV